jgi:polyhydroxyalkanoate synthesis regulator phasin
MASDFFSSLRKAADSLSNGEKSAADLGHAVNNWVKESGEALKEKIDSEFESVALRLGFVRKEDLETMAKRIASLEKLVAAISAGESTPTKKPKKKVSTIKKITVRAKKKVSK